MTVSIGFLGCPIGLLRGVSKFPSEGMPEWVNTCGERLQLMGVPNKRILEVIEEMERQRRKDFREKAGITQVTEFDEHLADMFNRFNV